MCDVDKSVGINRNTMRRASIVVPCGELVQAPIVIAFKDVVARSYSSAFAACLVGGVENQWEGSYCEKRFRRRGEKLPTI
jgi:hypothetical protein